MRQTQDLTEVMRMATVTVTATTMEHEIHDDDSTLFTTCYENRVIYVSLQLTSPNFTNGYDEYEMSYCNDAQGERAEIFRIIGSAKVLTDGCGPRNKPRRSFVCIFDGD